MRIRSLVMLFITAFVLVPADAVAKYILDASLTEVFESNLNPLLSGAEHAASSHGNRTVPTGLRLGVNGLAESAAVGTDRSDRYTILSASGGMEAGVGVETEASLKAQVERYQYRKFDELNATRSVLAFGMYKQFSDMHGAAIGLAAGHTHYSEHFLNGTSYQGIFNLHQQASSKLWFGEGFSYEKRRAKASAFTYNDRSVSARTDYRFSAEAMLGLVYACRLRKFGNGSQTLAHSFGLRGSFSIAKKVNLFLSADRQRYETPPLKIPARNSISSGGIILTF